MLHTHEITIGPVVLILLQKLANKHWLPTELFAQVKKTPNVKIVWQAEQYPAMRMLVLQGKLGRYTLTLPRKRLCGDAWLSAAPVRLQVFPPYAYKETEVVVCIEKLLSSTRSYRK